MDQLNETLRYVIELTKLDVIKIVLPAVLSFVIGLIATKPITKIMIKYDWQKKKSVQFSIDKRPAVIAAKIDNDENKILYRMGGLVVLAGVFSTVFLFRVLPVLFPHNDFFAEVNILSRSQTVLPIFMLLAGSLIGFVDDLMVVGRLNWIKRFVGGGLSLKIRIIGVSMLAGFCSWWLYHKLGINTVTVPYFGEWQLGSLYMLFAFLVILGAYGTSNIDGVDGLSGGLNSIAFIVLGMIAVFTTQFDIAALCFVLAGGLLAFLWFNIPPARFMNSETGYVGQILCLAVISLFIGVSLLLPIILLPAISAPVTVTMQLISKKLRNGRKIFLASPVHIHLQAIGWPKYKVTMRYWVIAEICAMIGMAVFLTGGYL